MKMNGNMHPTEPNALRTILLTLAGFAAYYLLTQFWMQELYDYLVEVIRVKAAAYLLAWLVIFTPVMAAILWMHTPKHFFYSLGLHANPLMAAAVTFLATLPMMAGNALLMSFDTTLTINRLLVTTLFAALFEEVIYRGFLFGQLFRFTRLGFIPAVVISALVFASGHLYQSTDPAVMAGVFMTTLAGGAFFAWLYAEWQNNLWVPAMLHLFMNLSWTLFSAGDNALGPLWPNIFRIATIALMIFFTLRHRRRMGSATAVNRKTLWFKQG